MRLISDAQLEANRRNAQKSTGPRTRIGLAAIAFNNRRHGLAGKFAILKTESHEEFKQMLDAFLEEYDPDSPTEFLLVERMAEHQWLIDRAICYQSVEFELKGLDEDRLALLMRYQTTHERAFQRCLNALLKLKAERRKEADEAARSQRAEDSRKIGFESQKLKEAAEKRKQELHPIAVSTAQTKLSREKSLAERAETQVQLLKLRNPELKTAQTAA